MFVANEAKLLQSLEGKCRNNTAKVIYLKLKLASSFFPISLREISTMTSGLAEKINRRGSVEISLSFPLSIAIYWLILGLLRSIRKSPRLMALGEECSSLPWPPVWSSVGHSWGSCSSAQQQLLRWWKLWFTTVHPLQCKGGGPCWSLNTFCPKMRAERVRNISVHNAGNRNVVIVGSGFWSIPFLLSYGLPFPVLHSASPACSFAAGWWQRQVSPCTKQSSATAAEMQCTAGGEKCRAESPWVGVRCPATQPVPATAPRQHLNNWSYWLCKINSYFY